MVSLRDFTDQDSAKLVQILNDEAVTKFLSTKIPSPYTQEDANWWINHGSQGELIKAICYGEELVGCIGVNRGDFEYNKSGEVGYWLAKEYWRKGIVSSALENMSHHVFGNTDILRIFAAVFSENTPSMQLLLKSGFTQEGIFRKAIFKNGVYYDSHIFAKLKCSSLG